MESEVLFTCVVTEAKYSSMLDMKSDSPGYQELAINGIARFVPSGSVQVPQTVAAQMPHTSSVQLPQTVTAQMPQTVNVIRVSSNNHLPPKTTQPITENGGLRPKMEKIENTKM